MRKSRGFTLAEMVIAMGVSVMVLAAALVLVQSQQRTYYGGQKGRAAQGSGRSVLLYLEQKVALAGFGMDPSHALDFTWYGCGGTGGCVRDRTDDTDELVFYARNPNYRVKENPSPAAPTLYGRVWETTSVAPLKLKVMARKDEVFRRGQILQLVCREDLIFTYVTLSKTITAPANGELELELLAADPLALSEGVAADPFRRQDMADQANADAKKWNGCLAATPRAFQIDRYRFHVRVEDLSGSQKDPYLVLDTGVDTDGNNEIDEEDELLIAEGIENFQVAYGFVDPTLAPAGTVGGTEIAIPAVGTAADAVAQTITPTDFPGDYDAAKLYPPLHSTSFFTRSSTPLPDERKTNAQGNIRTVRIVLVARSPEPSADSAANLRYDPGSPLWILNFDTAPSWITTFATSRGGNDGYQRTILDTTIAVPNLASRGLVPN